MALPRPVAARLALYLNLIRWDRPAGWLLLLWPSLLQHYRRRRE